MEFGIFLPSARNGFIISEASPQYSPSYPLMRDIVQAGEESGFSFALALSCLRGLGGTTGFWDDALEAMTEMAALSRDTRFMRLIGSVNVLAVHPAMAARMAMTIDSASDGRFILNIVPGGWHPKELEVLKVWPGYDYNEYRWEYCGEYCQVIRELWQTGTSSFKGKYFQFDDLRLGPRPERHINIVCAGTSQKAVEFTTRYADYQFRLAFGGKEALAEAMKKYSAQLETAGRTIKAYAALGIVLADTDEEAQAKLREYETHPDFGAINYMVAQASTDTAVGGTSHNIVNVEAGDMVRMSTDFLAGSPQTIARLLDEWSEIEGVAGYMLIFADYVKDIKRMKRDVFPLMKNYTPPVEMLEPA
ncbi:LLM class flavin-dependent oxidoreductase [Paraburkholderia sp. D1E]|uniref:LLM class flavin-dependent oxidoreductase n=1 Tax=Paraburkholderia sp. D1E TaxID=3461398 RepID=UPI004045FF8A